MAYRKKNTRSRDINIYAASSSTNDHVGKTAHEHAVHSNPSQIVQITTLRFNPCAYFIYSITFVLKL